MPGESSCHAEQHLALPIHIKAKLMSSSSSAFTPSAEQLSPLSGIVMDINIGPAFLRFYSGSNWSHLEAGFATNHKGGLARRETAVALSLKSEHALEVFSVENPADRYIAPDGTITHGRICIQGSRSYSLSAEQVFTAALHKRTVRAAKERALEQAQLELANALVEPIHIGTDGLTSC